MNEQQIQHFRDELAKRGADTKCPRCKMTDMEIYPNYILNELLRHKYPFQEKPVMRTIVMLCGNCGYICQHLQAVLGEPHLLQRAKRNS
jgi:hypothetical protein